MFSFTALAGAGPAATGDSTRRWGSAACWPGCANATTRRIVRRVVSRCLAVQLGGNMLESITFIVSHSPDSFTLRSRVAGMLTFPYLLKSTEPDAPT